ncbi:SC10B8A.06, unknown, len: 219 aa; located between inverted DNA repeat units [Alloactinosynnema sp. L-07]|uniref:hypothetical protein n=1 Tax=Alloactinosynnema sp. L-07 TaxID=1653480 RepID=UPI00065EF61F|nr:hypothetical protein [Alloactinosynnema sp. L-07]CRK58491.1 SC10B8A.06, unknown, len: 219 aa; located between inverted DNA repeat units [Alloactinosynnema sp. L-07]
MGDVSWIFDLVSPDDSVRGRALARHQAAVAEGRTALHWMNSVWARAGTPAPAEPWLAAEMDQARAAMDWHNKQTIFGLLDGFHSDDALVREMHAPFVVLYLVWEGSFPDEWRDPASCSWSPWTRKAALLASLAREGVPDVIRSQMTDLLIGALYRSYRCKDWIYAAMVRHLSDQSFVAKITELLDAEDPLVRLRAEYILYLAEFPETVVRRKTWRRWLAGELQRR